MPHREECQRSDLFISNSEFRISNFELKILHSEELALKRVLILYDAIVQKLKNYIQDILETSRAVAKIDLALSMAEVAKENNYVRPQILVDDRRIDIVEGRHPVVEKIISDDFVPNDTHLDQSGRIMLITGPNMAGKSIYMRQVALIVIMAHMGLCSDNTLAVEYYHKENEKASVFFKKIKLFYNFPKR